MKSNDDWEWIGAAGEYCDISSVHTTVGMLPHKLIEDSVSKWH